MLPSAQVADALWRCLCPSFRRPASQCLPILVRPRLRHLQTTTPCTQYHDHSHGASPPASDAETVRWRPFQGSPGSSQRSLLSARLDPTDSAEIHDHLRKVSDDAGYDMTAAIVRYLVSERGERPDARHYVALIRANASPERGSARQVAKLVDDMQADGIAFTAPIYQAIIKAISIHPSPTLLHATLAALPNLTDLPSAAHHDLVHALLRDRQPERALMHLFDMQSTYHITPEPWLLNLLTYALLATSAFPEATLLLRHHASGSFGSQAPIPAALWAYAMARGAENMRMDLVRLAWRNIVVGHGENGMSVHPSQGGCEAILECCARHGDVEIAQEVVEMLERRSGPGLEAWHWEALCEACLAADDIGTALDVLARMQGDARWRPTRGTCRALYHWVLSKLGSTRKKATDLLLARARPTADMARNSTTASGADSVDDPSLAAGNATATDHVDSAEHDDPATLLPIFAVEAFAEALADLHPKTALSLRPAVTALCGPDARPTPVMLKSWAVACEHIDDFAGLRELRAEMGEKFVPRPAQDRDPFQHRASDMPLRAKLLKQLKARRPHDWQEQYERDKAMWKPWAKGGPKYLAREEAKRRERDEAEYWAKEGPRTSFGVGVQADRLMSWTFPDQRTGDEQP